MKRAFYAQFTIFRRTSFRWPSPNFAATPLQMLQDSQEFWQFLFILAFPFDSCMQLFFLPMLLSVFSLFVLVRLLIQNLSLPQSYCRTWPLSNLVRATRLSLIFKFNRNSCFLSLMQFDLFMPWFFPIFVWGSWTHRHESGRLLDSLKVIDQIFKC